MKIVDLAGLAALPEGTVFRTMTGTELQSLFTVDRDGDRVVGVNGKPVGGRWDGERLNFDAFSLGTYDHDARFLVYGADDLAEVVGLLRRSDDWPDY